MCVIFFERTLAMCVKKISLRKNYVIMQTWKMTELVHAKLKHKYAAARRLSGLPRGLCYVDVFSVSDSFEPP